MKSISHKIVFIGITVILTFGMGGGSSVEPITRLQSAVKQLGQGSDFEKTGQILLSNPHVWGKAEKQDQIEYRTLKANVEADVLVAAFDVDINGFCKNDMILEVFYRDDIRQWTDKNNVGSTVVIKSRIDFFKDNQYVEIGHIKAEEDGKWKLARIFLERTLRQMVRAIDGSFQFKIAMPKSGSKVLPISYIRLVSIEHQEFVKLREKIRVERGLMRLDYKPTGNLVKPPKEWRQRGYVVYPVNHLELVFPNSAVDYDNAGEELKCFEVPGQVEPVSFVIYAYEDLKNVRVAVSDLHGASFRIPSVNIDIRQVKYNDQRWGWGRPKRYGTCPDYLSFANPEVDIKANSNCQFWLTINIPESAPAGFYKGKVTIYVKNKNLYSMPLYVDVLPIKLLENKIKHMLYHSPYLKHFHRDPSKVLEDMKKHGLVPVFYPPVGLVKTERGLDVRLNDFERQLQAFREVYPEAKELFVVMQYECYSVWRMMKGPKPEFARPFLEFELVYGRILKKYADLGRRYGLELYFSFQDEPFKHIEKRRVSYLCSLIAQSNGLKTWSTHRLDSDVQLPLTKHELAAGVNYLRPLREVLDVFVEFIGRVDESSIKTLQKSGSNLSYYTTYLATSAWPVYNRLLHGMYPFVTKNRFVVSYAYRDAVADPYDDMDVNARGAHLNIGANDYLLTYPTWQGDILPTLSYEALREGIEDSHLISTLQILAQEALQASDPNVVKLGKETQGYLDGILARLSKNFKGRYWLCPGRPIDSKEKAILRELNNKKSEDYEIFDKIRRNICDRIVALQNALAQ